MDQEEVRRETGASEHTRETETIPIQLVIDLLADIKRNDETSLPAELRASDSFMKLYGMIADIRFLSHALSRGNLQEFVYSKGYIISNLKALQSHLRHLTWQTQKLAVGDFSQRVDFLGEFSVSFNIMAQKLEDYSRELKRLAGTDTLTQVPNRRNLDEFLRAEFEYAKKNSTHLSALIFDIDHFKQINDTYGHSAGDIVLAKVSQSLNGVFRMSDMFARYGGEEFVAVLPGCAIEKGMELATRAIQAVANTDIEICAGKSIRVTASAGVSEMALTDNACADLINRSDAALYEAKRSGRNCVCIAGG